MNQVLRLFLEIFDSLRIRWMPIAGRYNVDLTARILGKSEDCVARIVDISESGCFASLDHHIQIGSLVGLDFKYQSMKVHAVAVVVRNTRSPVGSGFMFVASTKSERQAIRNLIRRLEADSVKNSIKQAA